MKLKINKTKSKGKMNSAVVDQMMEDMASVERIGRKSIKQVFERKSFAGLPPAKRQKFDEVCIFCGNATTYYPSLELTEAEINERQMKAVCSNCRKDGKSYGQSTTNEPICENCGDLHSTEECTTTF